MGVYINRGNEAFREVRNSEYVDKSGLVCVINSTLFTERRFTCVSRCRRFGKSMAAKMLAAYYDCSCDSRALFADLKDPEMTRYMMTLDDAIDLVVYAFTHGNNGDLFVQKAPAVTLTVLAEALLELFQSNVGYKIIGTRHGEKVYETLVTREEMARSEDMGEYSRIACDGRDLNYDKVEGGNLLVHQMEEYHSHNTRRLNKEEMKQMLLKVEYVRNQLGI